MRRADTHAANNPENDPELSPEVSPISKFRCEHGLDLRKYPRCYLCKPVTADVPVTTDRVVIRPYVLPQGKYTVPSTSWCSSCFRWHQPGVCNPITVSCAVDHGGQPCPGYPPSASG